MKKTLLLASLFSFLLVLFPIKPQAQIIDGQNGGYLISVFNYAGLHKTPEKKGIKLGTLPFGEQVAFLGETRKVNEENRTRTYLLVESSEGITGWVYEYLFVYNGVPAVVLESARIYSRPNTPSTITKDYFEPGEMVIVAGNVVKGWIQLVGKEKKKQGWIEHIEKVTLDENDIKFASLLATELNDNKKVTKEERTKALEELLREAQDARSPMATVITQRIDGTATPPPIFSAPSSSRSLPFETKPENIPNQEKARSMQVSEPLTAHQLREKLIETTSGKIYTESVYDDYTREVIEITVETGGVYEMNTQQNLSTIFYGYHKVLPIGSKVRLEIPDNEGFIELEIIDHLSNQNPNVIGLPRACIEAVFGEKRPTKATISYIIE